MRLRLLVPLFGLLAAPAAGAAEDQPLPVAWSGWVDGVLTVSGSDVKDDPLTLKDKSAPAARFAALAGLKASVVIADGAEARINAWFSPDTAANDNRNLRLRDAFIQCRLGELSKWTIGKYVTNIGLISREPDRLFTVNDSLIGYLDAYGNDVLGMALDVAPPKSPFSCVLNVTNGYFTGSDAISPGYPPTATANPHRENGDLGYGLDFIVDLGEKQDLRLSAAYDPHSDHRAYDRIPPIPADQGGNALLVDLNAKVKLGRDTTLGAEALSLAFGEGRAGTGDTIGATKRLQGALFVNFDLRPLDPIFPISVTLMGQLVRMTNRVDSAAPGLPPAPPVFTAEIASTRSEAVFAVMTEPRPHFHLNVEVAYLVDRNLPVLDATNVFVPGEETKSWAVSLQGLVSF